MNTVLTEPGHCVVLVFAAGYEVLQKELQYLALDDLESSVDQKLTNF
jgi:hypothetical protein